MYTYTLYGLRLVLNTLNIFVYFDKTKYNTYPLSMPDNFTAGKYV